VNWLHPLAGKRGELLTLREREPGVSIVAVLADGSRRQQKDWVSLLILGANSLPVRSGHIFHMTVGYCKIFTLAGKILNENGYLNISKRAINHLSACLRRTLSCPFPPPPPPGGRVRIAHSHSVSLEYGASCLNNFFTLNG
jgi:hypothetical protein